MQRVYHDDMRCPPVEATAVASGNRWKDFEAGDMSEATFLRLLGRLLDVDRYRIDAYGVYG